MRTKEEIEDRLAKYYAWKLIILQVQKIFLPEARQDETYFEREALASRSGFASNLLAAIARSRRARLEDQLNELRGRFAAMFGAARLPSA